MSFDEAVDALAAMPDRIASAIEEWTANADGPPGLVPASLREIVAGIAEEEIVLSMHIRLILAEAVPGLPPFDQRRWASEPEYGTQDAEVACRTFSVLRSENVRILRTLKSARRMREAWDPAYGTVTLESMVVHTASRNRAILGQIDALRSSPGRNASRN